MSEGQNETEISKKPFEERFEYFKKQGVVDVTNGLGWLIHDATELMHIYTELSEIQSQSRFPILGFNDGSVLMLGGGRKRFEHREILKVLTEVGQPKTEADILFATGLEAQYRDAPIPCLELTATHDLGYYKSGDKTRIVLAKTTDLRVPGGGGIDNEEGYGRLEKIFGSITGVEILTPSFWKK